MDWKTRLLAAAAITAILAGCGTVPPTNVHQPMTARPAPRPETLPANGAIFQAGYNHRPLFEDRRARNVGDTLIVNINEKNNATKAASSGASRTGSMDFSVPALAGLPGKGFLNSELTADSSNTFSGKGNAASNNAFTGTIAVTVIEVYPNGNLLVSGEKQVSIGPGTEFIRISGVVDPSTIQPSNTVSSAQIADARVEYKANGYIDEAQIMGWLARFFLTFLPF